jgi:hypothetical protein
MVRFGLVFSKKNLNPEPDHQSGSAEFLNLGPDVLGTGPQVQSGSERGSRPEPITASPPSFTKRASVNCQYM